MNQATLAARKRTGRKPDNELGCSCEPCGFSRPFSGRAARQRGFTLIEMIVVIGIISVLAALIFPVVGVIKKARDLKRTRTELTLVSQAIEGYQQKLGHLPPDNPAKPTQNTLFYELRGTYLTNNGSVYEALDHSTSITANKTTLNGLFNLDGFINCSRGAGGDEAQPAIKFLPDLKAGQYVDLPIGGTPVRLLGCVMDGPNAVTDPNTQHPFSPWWYNCSNPTNNPNSFDLWVDVKIGSKIYRLGNWSANYQVLN